MARNEFGFVALHPPGTLTFPLENGLPRLFRISILAATLSGSLVAGTCFWGRALEAAQLAPELPAASPPSRPPEQGNIAKLMSRLEEEIEAGRLSAPAGDNAIETLQQILRLVPDASPSDLDAIEAMPSRFDQRASEARARGDTQAAERFSAFRDAFALGGRATSTKTRATPPNTPAASPSPAPVTPPAASSTPAVLSGAVERLESKPETKERRTKAVVEQPASSRSNRPESAPSSPQPAVAAIAPTPTANPPEPQKPDRAAPGSHPESPNTANLASGPDPAITVLLKRGEEKLAQGDISAARLLFQRAAQARSGAGAAGMARSYDPVFLTNLGASGIQADSELATEWYRMAIALGDDEAAVELRRLERWKSESAGNLKVQPRARP